jgi:arylformamidase
LTRRYVDISMPVHPGMPAFPGDPVVEVLPTHSVARGDPYNVSHLSLGSHAGTHIDPPRHFRDDGMPVDQLDLDALNGPCVVAGIPPSIDRIGVAELGLLPHGAERVLFRTRNSSRWNAERSFFSDYVSLTLPGAEELVRRGVRLVGIDSLSIESGGETGYPVHHALLGRGVAILEGLLLDQAPPGRYALECLPLRIRDGDGAPARALLWSE